jgi:hypothetical protein
MGCERAVRKARAAGRESLRREPVGDGVSDWPLGFISVIGSSGFPAPAGQVC